MRARATSPETDQPTAHDALTALVRLLAREVARECVDQAPALPKPQEQAQPEDPKS